MNKHEEFIKSLYDKSDKELRELYKLLKKNKDEVSQKIADILFKYTINDGVMDIRNVERVKLYKELSGTITTTTNIVGVTEIALIENVLELVIKDTFEFWNYNINYEDVRKIIKKNFKGKHFSTRVWENEEEVAKRLHKLTHDFLDGKINVNQIKRDLEKIFNADAYNAKRLVETEVARCSSNAFDRFCEETGVKKVRYNATLDNRLCDDCSQYHNKVFEFKHKIEVPRHPLCRCFYTIEDEDYIENNSNDGIIKSGAISGALNPYSDEAQNHANKYYESVRHMKTDAKNISMNVGWSQNSIEQIKEHVFIKEHDLGNNSKERLFPSYDMAQSWQRLIEGKNIKEQDLVLLKHEYLELTLMKKGFSQAEAHNLASQKHNFAKYTK